MNVGMELAQKADFSVDLTQAEFAQQLELLDAPPALWKRRRNPLTGKEKWLRQRKMGELRWLATASRPDICARLAQLASKVNGLKGSDIYFVSDLFKTVEVWQPRAVLKYASSPFPFSLGARRKGSQ